MGTKYTVDNAGVVTLTNDLVVDTNVLKVDTAGNFVGINKTTPVVALDVVGAISATGTITGNLFSGSGASLTAIPQSAVTNLVSDLAAKATDSLVVHLAGIETITGAKTFNAAGTALTVSTNASLATLGVGTTTPVASALLEMVSTAKGFLAPRMTQAQRDAISSPATGLLIYNTDDNEYNYYDSTAWAVVGTGSGGNIERLETYVVGTPSGNYTGSLTVFDLVNTYTANSINMRVYVNGQLQQVGGANDYVETDTNTVTFNYSLVASDIVQFAWVATLGTLYTPTAGTERRESFSAAGGAQTFTLTTGTYTLGGTNLRVYVNGSLQKYTTNYSEASTTSFTISSGLTAGDNVEAVWLETVPGTVSYVPATETRQNYVGDGTTTTFTLTGSTFVPGGANLKVYADGVLMTLSDDYTEVGNTQVTFVSAPASGVKISLVFIRNTGPIQSSLIDNRVEFIATASQTVFSLPFTYTPNAANLFVYNDGVLMKPGDDYNETSNTVITFAVGRILNSKVTCVVRGGDVIPSTNILKWTRYTVAYTDLSTAATTNNITLFTLPAAGIIHGVKIKHNTSFTGGSISAYTLSVGITGTLAKYATAYNVFQATASNTFQLSSILGSEDQVATTAIKVAATSTGANLNAATAGSADIWVLTSQAL